MIAAAMLAVVLAADPIDLGSADHALLVQIAANTAAIAVSVQSAADAAAVDDAAQATFRGQLVFLAQVCAFAVSFCAGGISWRLFILAKNQRSIW